MLSLYILNEVVFFGRSLEQSKHVQIEHTVYEDESLPEEWDGAIVVHVSDLHIGAEGQSAVDSNAIDDLSAQIKVYLQQIGADPLKTFLIDTGDFVNIEGPNRKETNLIDVSRSLKSLATIPAAFWIAVEGNHDKAHTESLLIAQLFAAIGAVYAGDPRSLPTFPEIIDDKNLPFGVLVAPDYTTRWNDWYESEEAEKFLQTLRDLPPDKLTVLITHNPTMVDVWRDGEVANILKDKKVIVFCGHTHGGQLNSRSQFQKMLIEIGHAYRNYSSNLIKGIYHIGSSMVVVNSGIGQASGVRTLPPAVTVFEFRKKVSG